MERTTRIGYTQAVLWIEHWSFIPSPIIYPMWKGYWAPILLQKLEKLVWIKKRNDEMTWDLPTRNLRSGEKDKSKPHSMKNAIMVNTSIHPDIQRDIYSTLLKPWGFQNFQHYKVGDKREISPSKSFLLCSMFAWVWVYFILFIQFCQGWLSSYHVTSIQSQLSAGCHCPRGLGQGI